MKEVWKFPLIQNFSGTTTHLFIPEDSRPLHVGMDGLNQLCVWVMTEPHRPCKTMEVIVFGTGWQIPEGWFDDHHIGTYVTQDGFVWHIFGRWLP